jgi:hypothetical protein
MYFKLLSLPKSFISRCSASTSARASTAKAVSSKAQAIIDREKRFGVDNYHPIPVVIERGSGI